MAKEIVGNYTDKILLVLNSSITANSEIMGLIATILGSGTSNYGQKKDYDRIKSAIKKVADKQKKEIDRIFKDE